LKLINWKVRIVQTFGMETSDLSGALDIKDELRLDNDVDMTVYCQHETVQEVDWHGGGHCGLDFSQGHRNSI
jgi:hypothetical protein